APMETAQAVQREQKHARERTGAPSAPSSSSGGTREVAAPSTGGPSLELDRDWRGEAPRYVSTHQPQAAHSVPIHRPGRRGLPWRAIVVVLLLAGLGALGYSQRETIRRWLGYAPSSSSETVLILVETDPRDADIYLDNVLQMTRPIELARSKRTFELRVQKAGYHSRTVEVTAERTRSVRVKLRKR
ncbi:MAG: PEGA domain-containing protein, partial [Myxococcales bacterium]|nr:PEGA domain-containing protein [Myxococcales bacterium]